MDPSPEELALIKTVGAALDWAGLRGNAASESAETPRAAFLAAFGIAEDDAVRVLAAIPEAEYAAAARAIRIGSGVAPPGVVAKVVLAGRACRIACGVERAPPSAPPVTINQQSPESKQVPVANASAAVAAGVSGSTAAAAAPAANAAAESPLAASSSASASAPTGEGGAVPEGRPASKDSEGSKGEEANTRQEEDKMQVDATEGGEKVAGAEGAVAGASVTAPVAAESQSSATAAGPASPAAGPSSPAAGPSSPAALTPSRGPEVEATLTPVEIEQRRLKAFEAKLQALESDHHPSVSRDWDAVDERPGLGFAGSSVSSPSRQPHASSNSSSSAQPHDAQEAAVNDVDLRSVLISGLDSATTPEELKEFFQSCGSILRVTVLVDKFTQQPKGAAYIEFKDQPSVQNALLHNGSTLGDGTLKVVQKHLAVGKSKGQAKGQSKGHGKGKDPSSKGKANKGKPVFANKVYRPGRSAPY